MCDEFSAQSPSDSVRLIINSFDYKIEKGVNNSTWKKNLVTKLNPHQRKTHGPSLTPLKIYFGLIE